MDMITSNTTSQEQKTDSEVKFLESSITIYKNKVIQSQPHLAKSAYEVHGLVCYNIPYVRCNINTQKQVIRQNRLNEKLKRDPNPLLRFTLEEVLETTSIISDRT